MSVLKLEANTKKYVDDFQKAEKATESLKRKTKSLKKSMNFKLSIKAITAFTASVSASLYAINKLFIEVAKNAEETSSKFSVVFKGVEQQAKKSFRTLTDEYDLSRQQSKALLSNTGDLLTGFGFTRQEALRLATQVNFLAADLASFTNIEGGVTRASEALTKTFFGEYEAAKALGVVIKTDTKIARSRIKQLMNEKNVTELQAKAYFALETAISQSKNAVGDYSRTKTQLANSEKRFYNTLKDTREILGSIISKVFNLKKVYSDLSLNLKVVNSFLEKMEKLVSSISNKINNFQTKAKIFQVDILAKVLPEFLGGGKEGFFSRESSTLNKSLGNNENKNLPNMGDVLSKVPGIFSRGIFSLVKTANDKISNLKIKAQPFKYNAQNFLINFLNKLSSNANKTNVIGQEQKAGLAVRGSVEAYQAEIARFTGQDKVEENTKKTADNTNKLVELFRQTAISSQYWTVSLDNI